MDIQNLLGIWSRGHCALSTHIHLITVRCDLQHVVLIVKFLIEFLIDDDPTWVKHTNRRREYQLELEHNAIVSKVWHSPNENGLSAYEEYIERFQTMPQVEWHIDG
jgi:hypothetical protein